MSEKDKEYFTDVEIHGSPTSELSNTIGALVDAATAISGDSSKRINMVQLRKGDRYHDPFYDPGNPSEALKQTREVFYKLKKRVDNLDDVTLVLALENIFTAINQIVNTTKEGSANDGFAKARKNMEHAEQKTMEAFYQSLKDEQALALEDLEKTTISIQLAIFLKIIIPSFKLDIPDSQTIQIFHSQKKVDRKHIARNLKDLVDNLLDIQSRLKSKLLLPSNGTGRANAGKFQEMVDFLLKIVYPYFNWGAPNKEPQRNVLGLLVDDDDFSPTLRGNHPDEPVEGQSQLKIMPKYLGRGRSASCEVNIGRLSEDNYPKELGTMRTKRWDTNTVTVKLWRGESAIIGTTIEDRNGEEELVFYHELNNDNKEVEVKLLDALNHKWSINAKRNKEHMVILGLEDYSTSEPREEGEDKNEKTAEVHLEDNPTTPLQEDEKAKMITLVPKDFPTWSEDSLPIYTNNIVNLDPKPTNIKPPLPIVKYIARKFRNPQGDDLPNSEDGESVESINRNLYQSFLDNDRDSDIYDEEYDEDILWPWKPVVLNIWRGENALLGTVCGVLVFIQPFKNLSEKFTLDVNTLKRCCDWENLTNCEIRPGVNVNVSYLGVGYKTRFPIILGDFPKHKEDLLTQEVIQVKKNEEDSDEEEVKKYEKASAFWQGFSYSECPELVVEIWKEDDFVFGIIQGTDNVVIRQQYTSKDSTKQHLNLTLKESLENKPQCLGEFLKVSSSPRDHGSYLSVCGIYAKRKDGKFYNLSSDHIIINCDEKKGWQIGGWEKHYQKGWQIEYLQMQNPGQYQVPPVTGWRINEPVEKGNWVYFGCASQKMRHCNKKNGMVYLGAETREMSGENVTVCDGMVWTTDRLKPAPQINVRPLGDREAQVPEEVLSRTCISVAVYSLSQDRESRRPVSLEIDEDDVSALQTALGYNFWGGWIAGGPRRLDMKMWMENGFVIGTYKETDDVIFHQRLEDGDEEIFVSFDKLENKPSNLGELIFVNSTGAGNKNMIDGWFDNALGVYELQKFKIQDCPVFKRQRPAIFNNEYCAYFYIAILHGCWSGFALDNEDFPNDVMEKLGGEHCGEGWEDRLTEFIEKQGPFLKHINKADENVPAMPPSKGWSLKYLDLGRDGDHKYWMAREVPDWCKAVPEWKEDQELRMMNYFS